jgi:hypothetical protein
VPLAPPLLFGLLFLFLRGRRLTLTRLDSSQLNERNKIPNKSGGAKGTAALQTIAGGLPDHFLPCWDGSAWPPAQRMDDTIPLRPCRQLAQGGCAAERPGGDGSRRPVTNGTPATVTKRPGAAGMTGTRPRCHWRAGADAPRSARGGGAPFSAKPGIVLHRSLAPAWPPGIISVSGCSHLTQRTSRADGVSGWLGSRPSASCRARKQDRRSDEILSPAHIEHGPAVCHSPTTSRPGREGPSR